MRSFVAIAVLWVAALAGRAEAADLNAPLDDRPTVGSELLRGKHAASQCSMGAASNARLMFNCLTAAAEADEQKHPNYAPFEAGLFLFGCETLSIIVQSDRKFAAALPSAAESLPEAAWDLEASFQILKKVQAKAGLSDSDLVSNPDVSAESRASVLADLKRVRRQKKD